MADLWVVEMWNDDRERWEPTVGASLGRMMARREVKSWREDNPHARFRIVRYVRREADHG